MKIEGAQKNFVHGQGAAGGHWKIAWGGWMVDRDRVVVTQGRQGRRDERDKKEGRES